MLFPSLITMWYPLPHEEAQYITFRTHNPRLVPGMEYKVDRKGRLWWKTNYSKGCQWLNLKFHGQIDVVGISDNGKCYRYQLIFYEGKLEAISYNTLPSTYT